MCDLALSSESVTSVIMDRFKAGVSSVEVWGFQMHIIARSALSKKKIGMDVQR